METTKISPHQLKVYAFVATAGRGWVTAAEIAAGTGVSYRATNDHCKRLVEAEVFELAPLFPSYHYRLSPVAGSKPHMARLKAAQEVLAGTATAGRK
jgi:hypothetical protein